MTDEESADGLSRAERSDRTRENLLASGLEILREESSDRVFERLEAKAISARAGVTTGAFYHHFDGADGYTEALLHYCLLVDKSRPFAVASPRFEAAVESGANFVDAFIDGAGEILRYQDRNLTFVLQVAVWAKRSRDIAMTKRLKQMYANVTADTGAYYAGILELLGRTMREPYTLDDLTTAFTALFEGLAIRRAVDPDAVPDSRLGELLVPLLLFMTHESGDDQGVGGWLSDSTLTLKPIE